MSADLLTSQPISLDLNALNADVQRIKYMRDPVSWIDDDLGEFMWSKQKDIIRSIANNRRTAVMSCHTIGKSHVAARAVAWWIKNHAPGTAYVITSAGRGTQVKTVLWRYIGRVHAENGLPGRVNMTEWHMDILHSNGKTNEEIVAMGRKPADLDPGAFSGIHAEYVLVIFDEACAMHELLWDYADTLISNESSKFLAIGNPDDPTSEFASVCSPNSGWNVIRISAFDCPAYTGEAVPEYVAKSLISPIWVEEKRKKWGEKNPLWFSKIEALFPESGTDGLIPLAWIHRAQELDLSGSLDDDSRVEMGVDVGAGGDESIVCVRKGYRCRIVREDKEPNTMTTLGNVISDARECQSNLTKVDYIGIGRGIVDKCKLDFKGGRMNWDHCWDVKKMRNYLPIIGITVSWTADYPEEYINLRAQIFWGLRQLFEENLIDIDPEDDDLAAQLVSLKYRRTAAGKMQISPKTRVSKAKAGNELEVLLASPNRADALGLCCMPEPKGKYRSMSRKPRKGKRR